VDSLVVIQVVEIGINPVDMSIMEKSSVMMEIKNRFMVGWLMLFLIGNNSMI